MSLFRFFIAGLILLCSPLIFASPEPVSIQLKWKHSFQFAGYYAAIEKGFYRDAGLDVTLKELDFSKDFVEQVIAGESEYGVSDSTLLLFHLRDKPVVLINQIFQHSPLVLMTHRGSGILSPYEMVDKKVALNAKNEAGASLVVMLLNMLGDMKKIQQIPFDESSYQDFVEGKIDVVSAYSTSVPYLMQEQDIDINIINPQNYGIDFYGDNFFTSLKELEQHPERVKKMSQASIKGWQYALDHPDEIIQLILKKYTQSISEAYLQYEARSIRQIIIPELIELGSFELKRYQQVAEVYQRLGLSESSQIKNDFFYGVDFKKQAEALVKLTEQEQAWIKDHPQVSVGGGSEWAPFDFVDKKGQYSGFANDYLKLIAEKTGLNYKVTIDQWSHHLQNIRDKKIDLLGAAYYTKERTDYVNFSTPYIEVLDYFFIRDDLDVKTLADLNGKRVAIPKAFAHGEIIKQHFPEINIVAVDDLGDAIDAVLENRADMLFDNYAALTYVLKKQGVNTIIAFKSTRDIGNNPIHIATRKGAPELASIIQKGLDAISDQEKQAIYNKWLGNNQEVQKPSLELTIEQQQWLTDHPIIRIGAESDWPPYEFIDPSGQLQGLSADVIHLLEQQLGIKFEIISKYAWAETLEKVKNHDIDVVSSIVKTPDREQFLSFGEVYAGAPTVIFTRKDNAALSSLEDLKNKTVAIEDQYYMHKRLVADYPRIKLLPVKTTFDALKALSHGKVDAYIGNQGVANWVIEQNVLTNLQVAHDTGLGSANIGLAVRKDWPIFQKILDKAITSIPETELKAIRRKWLGIDANQLTLRLSASEQRWLEQHKIIRFTGDPNWLPYEAFDQQGNYIGIVAEHLKLIEQKLGITVEIIPTQSWAESVDKVKRGEIDILSETSDSNLKSQLSFTQEYISSPVVIIMRNEEDYIGDINQIKQRKIAVIEDYGYVPEIIKKHPDLGLHPVKSIQEGLTAVSTGKVDALLATLAQASFHISKLGINNIRIVGETEFSTKLAFGMREDFAPLIPLFNRALDSISQGEKQRIFDVWGKLKYTEKIDYELIAKIAGTLLFIIAAVVFWNRKLSIEVDKRKASEAEAKLLNQRFTLATDLVSLGVWEWDLSETNSFIFDERMFEMYKMPHQNPVAYSEWIPKVHVDDHQAIENALQFLQKNGGQQHLEFRIFRPDGSIRYIYCGATILFDEKDGSTKLFGVNWDITERKQAESQFKAIIDALPLAIVIADHKGNILLDNPQAIKEIGDKKSLTGRNTQEFYADPQEKIQILEILQEQKNINGRQVKYQIAPDKTIDCLLSIIPVNYHNQQVWLAVIVNLTDRIKYEKDLADAKVQAENANRAKSEFLSNMSHEIRTPMNAIIGFTELLSEQVEEPRLKSFVKTIQSASHNLLTLINDILDLSKIEAGKFQIEKTPCNPHDLFSELGNIFMMKMREKNLDFILDIDPVIPQSLQMDAIRLRQVLLNLVGNAVKFTDKGFIKLIARTDNADTIHSKLDLVIDIEDSGIGIAEDQQSRIFQEFEQSSGQDVRTYGGTGLGLSISKRLITLMGGELTLKSQLAKGSTFTIKLSDVDIASLTTGFNETKLASKTQLQFHPAKLLIVDDVKDNRDLLLALFTDTKLQLVEAENGLEAVDLVKQQPFDFILMDIRMPVMDGYQATQEIKAFSSVPIVALTASVMTDDFERLKDNKFDGFLRKPVLKADLFRELSKFLPFEQIAVNESAKQVKPLNAAENKSLPFALKELKKLTEQCNTVSKANNISEIQAFADALMNIARQHPVSVISEYAEQLNNDIDSFEIAAIKRSLNDYPQLIKQLQQLLKPNVIKLHSQK